MIAGSLEIQMLANMARLQSDMTQARNSVSSAMDHVERSVNKAKAALGALGVGLSVRFFVNLINSSIELEDHLNDLHKSTNITIEDLAGLNLLAKQSGTDLDGLAKGINKIMVEMGKDPGKFAAIGITAKDGVGVLMQFADIFNSIPDIATRNAVAQKAFSKSWAELAPGLAEGSKHILEVTNRGAKYSGITTESAKKADEFKDKLAELNVVTSGWTRSIADPLVSWLLEVNAALKEGVHWSDLWSKRYVQMGQKPLSRDTGILKIGGGADVSKPFTAPSSAAVKAFIGGAGDEAAKKALSEYDALKKSILEKTAAEKAELESVGSLTSAQKEYAQWLAMVDAHLTKMTPKQIENSKALWDNYLATAALNKEKEEQAAAMEYAHGQMDKEIAATVKAMEEQDAKISEFSKKASQNIQDSMADFLFDPFSKGLSGMLDGFTTMIRRMVAEAAAAQLAKNLFGSGIGSGGGSMGPWINAAMSFFGMSNGTQAAAPVRDVTPKLVGSFATGTDYVPRTGLALVHQGERITPASENSSSGMTVVNHFNIAGQVDSRTQMQIAQQAGAAVNRAMRRNG